MSQYPLRIPASGGEVVLLDEDAQRGYDKYNYSAVRRVGNTLYVSGVVVTRRAGEGNDEAAFKAQTRRAFERLRAILGSAGATFEHVVSMRTFHVWEGPDFPVSRFQHIDAFVAVKQEFMRAPHPAWTAVGTTGLLSEGGLVEIEFVAQLP